MTKVGAISDPEEPWKAHLLDGIGTASLGGWKGRNPTSPAKLDPREAARDQQRPGPPLPYLVAFGTWAQARPQPCNGDSYQMGQDATSHPW